MKDMNQNITLIGAFVICLLVGGNVYANDSREVSGKFPVAEQTSDTSDILESHPQYVAFAIEVGKEVDNKNAQRLATLYTKLRRHYPDGAAKFLKGLRFEMVQKVSLMGADPETLSSNNAEMRRFVARMLPMWVREADEHLFRSYSVALSRKNAR